MMMTMAMKFNGGLQKPQRNLCNLLVISGLRIGPKVALCWTACWPPRK